MSDKYIVRCNWNDKKTQLGTYSTLANAKKAADKDDQWYVFNAYGRIIYPVFKTISEKIERVCKWCEAMAKSPLHGYDTRYRWGGYGDYCCSSLVIVAFANAGLADLKAAGAIRTKDIPKAALKNGFADVTKQVTFKSGKGLKRGDILIAKGTHTALYLGNKKLVQATSNEKGTITGGKPGDQTGGEIGITAYYNYPWTQVLRYEDKGTALQYRVQLGLFKVKKNAESMKEKAAKAKIVTTIVKDGENYIVQAGLYKNPSYAQALYNKVKKANLPCAIIDI